MWVFALDLSRFLAKNEWFTQNKFVYVFDSFSPFWCPTGNCSCRSLLLSLFAHSLFFKEWLERFAPVALYKRATVSDLIRLLMTKDQWERFTLFTSELLFRYKKTKLITQKTDERIPNPTFCVLSWKMVIFGTVWSIHSILFAWDINSTNFY